MKTSIKFIYDFPFVKQIIGYLLIPFLIFIIICSIALLIYSAKHKNHEDPIYKYRINLASLIVSILVIIVFLAILTGFALAFKKQMESSDATFVLSYFVVGSPIVPLIALLILFIKMIRLMKNKPKKEEVQKVADSQNLNLMMEEVDNPNQNNVTIETFPQPQLPPEVINQPPQITPDSTEPQIEKEKTDIELL